MKSSSVVLDASAVLAFLLGERGGADLLREMRGSLITAVNWTEVVEKTISVGIPDQALRADFEDVGVGIVAVDAGQAEHAARLRQPTRALGLSLADRICLALAAREAAPVLTADRAWADLDVGVEVRLIR